ncbi:replication protein [Zooshikella ganghwensis]|uniref:replication protein n=1 Tax=Zooshikella ganghwensis TaxID=202772 RepID=UPI00056E5F6E|nr:replication protein [Zooshikella ganghwensis]
MNMLEVKNNDISYLGSHSPVNSSKGDVKVVDIKNGYTRVADELLETLCSMSLSGREFRLVLSIIRKTYGFHKSKDYISLGQLSDMSDIHKKHLSTLLNKLVDARILLREGQSSIKLYAINPALSEWRIAKPIRRKSPNTVTKSPKTVTQKSPNPLINTPKMVIKENPKSGDLFPENGDPFPENGDNNKDINIINKNNNTPPRVPPVDKKSTTGYKSPTRSTTTKSAPAPNEFLITPNLINWAIEKRIQVDLDLETEKFLNHYRAKGSKFSCWTSAWRNWMLRAQTYANEKPFRQSPPPGNTSQLDWNDTSWRFNLGL